MGYGNESAPPGWYPDPLDPALERYYDGATWSPRTRTPGPETSASPSSPDGINLVPGTIRYSERSRGVGAGAVDPHGFYQVSGSRPTAALPRPAGPPRRTGLTALLLTLLAGAILIGLGLSMYRSATIPPSYTGTASATVLSTGTSSKTSTCLPTVTYQVSIRTYTARSITSVCSLKVGSTVTVYYDPHNADLVFISASTSTQLKTWLFVGLGAALILIGFARRFA